MALSMEQRVVDLRTVKKKKIPKTVPELHLKGPRPLQDGSEVY